VEAILAPSPTIPDKKFLRETAQEHRGLNMYSSNSGRFTP